MEKKTKRMGNDKEVNREVMLEEYNMFEDASAPMTVRAFSDRFDHDLEEKVIR